MRIKCMWKPMWNPIWSVCENMCELQHVSSMWNSFPILWGFTCESLCETPCEVYVKICVKGLTSFHTLFAYISLCKISHACEISVWNSCEKCVKRVWKLDNIHTFFHMMFHIHTPSSVKSWKIPQWCIHLEGKAQFRVKVLKVQRKRTFSLVKGIPCHLTLATNSRLPYWTAPKISLLSD